MGPLAIAALPAGISALGNLAGGLLGRSGQNAANAANAAQVERMNQFNANQAQLNRDFQSQQRSTQYQTAVEDMRAAGLNPALAYHQGGAGTPGGTSASGGAARYENPNTQLGAGVGAAANSASNVLNLSQQKAQIDNIEQDTRAKTISANQSLNEWETKMALMIADRELRTQEWRFKETSFADRVQQIAQELRKTSATASGEESSTRLMNLKEPLAENLAKAQKTWWMKHISPFLSDAKQTSDIGGNIFEMAKDWSSGKFLRSTGQRTTETGETFKGGWRRATETKRY